MIKENRITVYATPPDKINESFDSCDLCDEPKFPQMVWHCISDDPAHITRICLDCVKDLGTLLAEVMT